MINIPVEREPVANLMALDAILRDALPDCCGFTQSPAGIIVHIDSDTADPALERQAQRLVMGFVDTLPEEPAASIAADAVIQTKDSVISVEALLRRIRALEEMAGITDDDPPIPG